MADQKKKTQSDNDAMLMDQLDETVQELQDENVTTQDSEVESLKQQLHEASEKYKRVLADFHNLERQTQESHVRFAKLATQGFVEELVGPFDHLKLASDHLKDKGLDMVLSQFRKVFEEQGLSEFSPVGEKFDAERMEAVGVEEGKADEVITVVASGYALNGIVIRPAKVIVGKQS